MHYTTVTDLFEQLEATSKRLDKTYRIAQFLKKLDTENIQEVMPLLEGRLFPKWDARKIGVAASTVLKAIAIASGDDLAHVKETWKQTGDLGQTAQRLIASKKQATLFSETLSLAKVVANLKRLADIDGTGSVDRKLQYLAELLTSAKGQEAKYIVRTVVEDLRIGVGEGGLRDAIVWAFLMPYINYDKEKNTLELTDEERAQYNRYVDITQQALDVTNDFSEVAAIAKKDRIDGLQRVTLTPGKPVKVMLPSKVKSVEEGFKRCSSPANIELKLDGFRMQIHKIKDSVKIFTRNLEEVSMQFSGKHRA